MFQEGKYGAAAMGCSHYNCKHWCFELETKYKYDEKQILL